MKERFLLFILLVCSFFCVGCKSVKNVAFPFLIDYEKDTMPYFEVPLCDDSGNSFCDEKVRFGIDTGNPCTFLYKSGVEYIFNSVEDYYNYGKENGFDIENSDTAFCLYNVNLNFGTYSFEADFRCYEKEENEKYDGIIGKEFMQKAQRITLDFKNNVLVINGKKIKKNVLPMSVKAFSDEIANGEYLCIPAEIDGKIYDVIVDTGACSHGVNAIVVSGKFDFGEEVFVKIGNEVYDGVKVALLGNCDFDDKNLETHYDSFFANTIIIGNAFFKNHRIQLDFENMEFAMD